MNTKLRNEKEIESLATDISNITIDIRYSVAIQLIYTGFLFNKYLDVLLSAYNISGTRLQVLMTLAIHGGICKPSELTRFTLRSKQNLSGIINNLLKSGLVSKQQDVKDRRSYKIAITKKGIGLVKASLPIISDAISSIVNILDEKRTEELKANLKSIRKSLYQTLEIERY